MERSSQLQEIRARQEKWLRERQAEMDRERVVSELRADSMSGPGSAGKASCCRRMAWTVAAACVHTHACVCMTAGAACMGLGAKRSITARVPVANRVLPLQLGSVPSEGHVVQGWLLTTMGC